MAPSIRPVPPPLVVAVTDPILPANTGTYRIEDGGVTRVDEPADLGTDVSALAAAYLGGTRWRHLALAGRVTEHGPGAAATADALFEVDEHPFSGTYFRPPPRSGWPRNARRSRRWW
ncbi:sterol carrier protein domain-containing protein [Nocardia sp. NPDC050193]